MSRTTRAVCIYDMEGVAILLRMVTPKKILTPPTLYNSNNLLDLNADRYKCITLKLSLLCLELLLYDCLMTA